jgi:hypothetical protein
MTKYKSKREVKTNENLHGVEKRYKKTANYYVMNNLQYNSAGKKIICIGENFKE